MTIKNGICDFCSNSTNVMLTQVEVEFWVDGKSAFWCGMCPAGSNVYFQDLDSETMVELIAASQEVLEEFMDLPDIFQNRIKKQWIENEVFRAKRELVFRVMG